MDKKLYLEFRKYEEEAKRHFKTLNEINDILRIESFFKESDSIVALNKIKAYYNKIAKSNKRYKLLKNKMEVQELCLHEVVFPTYYGYECVICRGTLAKEEISKNLILDCDCFYEVSKFIYDIIDYLIQNDLDIYTNFEKVLEEKICCYTGEDEVIKSLKIKNGVDL